ncbi:phospholipid carrier-dependent glycosyltransferase [bacterium]|nr:MAG: phospholipid carrier-dependent glycosyltransferase [bacterium]
MIELKFLGLLVNKNRSILLLFCTSLLSSILLTYFIGYPRGIGTDGVFYALSGYNLFHGIGFTYSDVPNTFTWPMMSILIGLLSLVMDDLQASTHVILVLAVCLGLFPFYGFVKNLFGDRIAGLAAILYALNGFLIRIAARIMPESLLIFFLLASFYFTSSIIKTYRQDEKTRLRDWLACGLFLGLAYLTKPEAFQYFVIILVFLFATLLHKRLFKRDHLRLWAMSGVTLLVILPQILFIHEATGKWELTTYNRFHFRGYVEPFLGINAGALPKDPHVEYNYNAFVVRGEYNSLDQDMDAFVPHVKKYGISLLTIIGFFHLILLLLSFVFAKRHDRYPLLFLYSLLFPMWTMMLWYTTRDSYFVMHVPVFLVISAYTIFKISERIASPNYKKIFMGGSVIVLLLQSYTPMMNHAPTNSVIGNHKKLGEWMRDHYPEAKGKLIADRKPYVAFSAKARYFRYNNPLNYETLLTSLKKHEVDYLVVDDFYTRTKNPGVAELLDGRDRKELKFIYAVDDSSWGKAVLYKLRY